MRHVVFALTRWVAPALAMAGLAAPAAATSMQDLRSPDARDAATQAQSTPDLRSPDARDAAQGRGMWNTPRVMVVKVSRPQVSSSPGFDWADAAIGAGAGAGLVLLAMGGTLVLVHRGRDTGAKRAERIAMGG